MADEVVEIVSSDDEIENLNGIATVQSEDEIVLVEPSTTEQNYGRSPTVLPWSVSTLEKKKLDSTYVGYKSCPQSTKKYVPLSNSRQEIKSIIRSSTQVSMSRFLNHTSSSKRKRESDDSGENNFNAKKQRVTDTPQTRALSSERDEVQCITSDSCEAERGSIHQKKHLMALGSNDEKQDQDESSTSKASVSEFIKKWTSLKGRLDRNDKKIEDKIWKYYYLAHSSFTHSKTFLKNVEFAVTRLNIDNVYVLIKDFLDCLKSYKDVPYKEVSSSDVQATDTTEQPQPASIEDSAVQKKLRKIEKTMKKLDEQIKVLDETEVDLSDEDNSAYLVQERLKAQFMKLDDYYCKLAGCSRSTGRPVEKRFRYEGSRYSEINQRISAWINKHREFPDYQDVLNLVKKVTDDSALPLRPETVRVQAQEIFRDVGKMLKERRENDDLYSIYSYCDSDVPDPASQNPDLASTLDENARIASEKLVKVFQEYVDKEAQQREFSDKKADAKKTTDDETTVRDGGQNKYDCKAGKVKEPEEKKNSVENSEGQESSDTSEPQKASTERLFGEDSDNEPYPPIVQQEIVFDDGRGAAGGSGWTPDNSDDEKSDVLCEDDGEDEELGEANSVCSSLPDIETRSNDDCNSNEASHTDTVSRLYVSNQSVLKFLPVPVTETDHANERIEDDGSLNNAAHSRSVSPMNASTETLNVSDSKAQRCDRTIPCLSTDDLKEFNKQGIKTVREFDSCLNSKSNGLVSDDKDVSSVDELRGNRNLDMGLVDSLDKSSCLTPKASPPDSPSTSKNVKVSQGKLISPRSRKRASEKDKFHAHNGIYAAEIRFDKLPSSQSNKNRGAKETSLGSTHISDNECNIESERSEPYVVTDFISKDLGVSNSECQSLNDVKDLVLAKESSRIDRNGNSNSNLVSDTELCIVSCNLSSGDNLAADVDSQSRSDAPTSVPPPAQLGASTHSAVLKSCDGQPQVEPAEEIGDRAVLSQLHEEYHPNSIDDSSHHDNVREENSDVQAVKITSNVETTLDTLNSDSISSRTQVSPVSTPRRTGGTGLGSVQCEGTAAVVTLEASTESDEDRAETGSPRRPPWVMPLSTRSCSSDEVQICDDDAPAYYSQNIEEKRELKLFEISSGMRSPSWNVRRNKLREVTPILAVPNGRHHQPSSPELVEID
ncbi:hypothetical protein FHG87_001201 [Trinorchestia longiramus]|nr:hypothetical protein FHG87_001201 [Trinorchestia longiramus]